MKKLILFLALALLLCGCVDGATKIGLDRLNWSQSIDGIKFSGTAPASTAGVLYSDSGELMFGSRSVSDRPTLYNISCIYSNGLAHAKWENGSKIISNSNNTTVIQQAITKLAGGGTLLLKDKFVISSSLTSTADISIIGMGYHTGLSGTASPLITIEQAPNDLKFRGVPHYILWNMLIETTGNNDGVSTTGYSHGMKISNVAFLAHQSSTLVHLTNWRIGSITDCYFSQEENEATANSTAIKLTGNSTYGMCNSAISTSVIWGTKYGIVSIGANKTEHCGLRITDSNIQECKYSVWAKTTDDIQIIGCMIDTSRDGNSINLNNTYPVRIEGSYIGQRGTGKAVKFDTTTHGAEYITITGNTIKNYDGYAGDGVYIGKVNQAKFITIANNAFNGWARAVNFDKDGAGTYHDQPIVSGNQFILVDVGINGNGMANGCVIGNTFAGIATAYVETKVTGIKVAHNFGIATHNE
jgi:hypothetical protein